MKEPDMDRYYERLDLREERRRDQDWLDELRFEEDQRRIQEEEEMRWEMENKGLTPTDP